MTDYDRIAHVIRFIEEHRDEQPDLHSLAAAVGLSPSHFHRMFSSWAGITSKEFLQCLTLEHARLLLKEGSSVLDAALGSGLSGPGRLHELTIKLEAATPGEIKDGGAGWTIRAGYADTPFGHCLIAESPRGICHLSFEYDPLLHSGSFGGHGERIEADWPNAEIVRDDRRARELTDLIFMEGRVPPRPHAQTDTGPGGTGPSNKLRLFVRGTDFQVKVWRALLRIPEGKLVSYGHLAGLIGKPKASRAVGSAVGNNPIGFLIPCHRVIRETGAIGGYRWGTARKQAIQIWEAGRMSVKMCSRDP
jgi:AraC family transcriptional regulator of adaptative response/methylated-DNA-[protein]-cysteine methyltransferase